MARSAVLSLAGLVQDQHVVRVQRDRPAQLVGAFGLAEELGDVVGLGQALVASTRAALVEVVSPMTRRPVNAVHSRANPAMVWLLPAPAGAISTVVGGGGGEHHDHGVALLGVQVRVPGGRGAAPFG